MSDSEKLDYVLNKINEHENFIASRELYEQVSDKIGKNEVRPIVDKLFQDLYIEKKLSERTNVSNLNPPYFCRITFSGKVFNERGGYQEENKLLKKLKLWLRTKSTINALNALLVLLVAIAGVYVAYISNDKEKTLSENQTEIQKLKKEIEYLKSKEKISPQSKTSGNNTLAK